MSDELFPQDGVGTDGTDFFLEKWAEASGGSIPPEVQLRIFREIKMRASDASSRRKGGGGRRPAVWVRYAAALILLAGVGIASHLYTRRVYATDTAAPAATGGEIVVAAEKGQRANVTLPDGTKVWLNSHSRITCPDGYGKSVRLLRLTGEAYFEVARDTSARFVVEAGGMSVEALGTSFNVKAYEEDADVVATLFTGSVAASALDTTIRLMPAEEVRLRRDNRQVSVSRPENLSYAKMWMSDELAFDKLTMKEIAVMLNRMYNVEIVFRTPAIEAYRFSGIIKNNSLDNVIELISLTAPISYRSRGDTIILDAK
ncbi:MAG: DUF4974 domain-containing protein [Tannerellaceae bacterium]|jgi:ferric-dicitrate binding protein FerR (iron transport regulator)|nr:DUF4974 domain-containing protein [Tannerellaceae bacterium]